MTACCLPSPKVQDQETRVLCGSGLLSQALAPVPSAVGAQHIVVNKVVVLALALGHRW